MKKRTGIILIASLLLVTASALIATRAEAIGAYVVPNRDEAIVISWQNRAGFWWAIGPTQKLWAGEKTERDAVDYVYQKSNDRLYYVERRVLHKKTSNGTVPINCKIYRLGRPLNKRWGELDARKYFANFPY